MPELRHDPVQKRWVIIATERAKRPFDFTRGNDAPQSGKCPFLINDRRHLKSRPETKTLKRSQLARSQNPALRIEGDLERAAAGQYDR